MALATPGLVPHFRQRRFRRGSRGGGRPALETVSRRPGARHNPLSVAITWQTSFDQLTIAGRELLKLVAWFAPDPIPESLLAAGGGPWGNVPSEYAVSSEDPQDALSDLEAYSLVSHGADAESPTFSVHRLVADVAAS